MSDLVPIVDGVAVEVPETRDWYIPVLDVSGNGMWSAWAPYLSKDEAISASAFAGAARLLIVKVALPARPMEVSK